MDPAHLNKLFSISNWLFLIPCYCQNSIGDLWNTLVPTVTASETPEAEAAPDVPTAEASEEGHNASQQVIQSKNSFKYKSSHPEDQIIGNKDSPRRTRSHFRPEESTLGLLSMIEPSKVDEALTDDGWILAMQDVINSKEMMCGILYLSLNTKTLLEPNGCLGTSWMNKEK